MCLTADNADGRGADTLRAQGAAGAPAHPGQWWRPSWKQKLEKFNVSSGPVSARHPQLYHGAAGGDDPCGDQHPNSAVDAIADQTENPKFKQILYADPSGRRGGEAVQRGARPSTRSSSDALYVNMVRASEMSG